MRKIIVTFVVFVGLSCMMAYATVYSAVVSQPASGWAGKYLIVYKVSPTQAYVWDGTDDSKNYVPVTLNDKGQISADNLSGYLVTVASEGGKEYSVKTADGYLSVGKGDNKIEFSRGAVACTLASNGGYVVFETNSGTERFVYNSRSTRFRFYYDKDKKWSSNDYHHICFYAEGEQQGEAANTLDMNYAHAEMYACSSKFPTQSNPYDQYFWTVLFLAQEEDDYAVPRMELEILAPTQYSIEGTYKSSYTPEQKYYLNITNGSHHSSFVFPNKSEQGYATAALTVAEMTISKVGPSALPNAYKYHIKLEFTDSNRKIWHLDKDMDVYGWWIDCNRQGKTLEDMEPVAFTLESGKHIPSALETVVEKPCSRVTKIIHNGKMYILRDGQYYDIFGFLKGK